MPWKESNRIFTYDQHSGPTVVFAGDATSGGSPHYAPGQWHTIDLKPLGVSGDAKFAEINGFLIITDAGAEIDNLTATFRPPGSTLNEGNYQMQGISVWSGGGERTVQSVTVGLVNGCFEFFWQKTVGGVPESGHPTAFLLNLWLAKWGRYEPAGTDQSTAIADLQTRVAALEAVTIPPDFTAEITAIQTQIAALQAQDTAFAANIEALEAAVAALQQSPPPQSPTVISVPPGGVTIQLVQTP